MSYGACAHCLAMGLCGCNCGVPWKGLGANEGQALLPSGASLATMGGILLGTAGEASEFAVRSRAAEGKTSPGWLSAFRDLYSPRAQIEKVVGKAESAGKWVGLGIFAIIALVVISKRGRK